MDNFRYLNLSSSSKFIGEFTERKLDGLKVAILATDGFEQSELFEPKRALRRCRRGNTCRFGRSRRNKKRERKGLGRFDGG
jgi:hypothetical protein